MKPPKVIIPMSTDNWNPTKVEYSVVCDTIEQFELFADFMKEMKALKELKKK
jgi:hypothetical protein